MNGLLWRASCRHLARHPWQIGLCVLGIALGVAVALSIDLATQSAGRAFALAAQAVTGRATHQILGGPGGLPEDVYRRLRVEAGLRDIAPVVAADVAAADHPGRTFHLLGVDPLAEAPFRPYLGGPADRPREAEADLSTLFDLVARPGTALLTRETGRALGVERGGALALRAAGQRRTVTVIGWIEPADRLSARALESVLVTDIATAQELLQARGRLSRIDVVLPAGPGEVTALATLRRAVPPGAEVVPAAARTSAAASMTRAFTLNLTALSLLALVVGMFLIYNAMTFSVVQRRPLIGTLRALGVTRGEVFTLVVVEALAVGVVGTLLGIGLGLGLARGLLGLVTRTINDLYFVLSVREVTVTAWALGKAVLLGVGATVVATLPPAWEATGARPREALTRSRLEARARGAVPRLAAAGGGLLLASGGVVALPGGPGMGFLALFMLLMGAALVTPALSLILLGLLQAPASRVLGLVGRLAARGVAGSLSRTAVAIAALMIAVAATIGVSVMIASFREAVVQWLGDSLRADVYVSPPSLIGNRPDATLPPAVVERLATAPGVAGVSTSRGALVSGPGGPVQLVALGLGPGVQAGFTFRGGRPVDVWRQVEEGAVAVSEPYAYRHGVRVGDTVRLRTDRGEHDFRVAGVFYDYGSSAGVVALSRRTYDRFWDDRAVSALGLYAAPGVDPEALVRALRARAAGGPDVVVRSNRALREASLEIFDRTFAITAVLRLLIVAVAFVGVLSALMALALERTREVGLERALGLTPRQVWGVVTAQTGLMGLVAGLLALPVGVGLAVVLVFVINRRSFGWTMPIDVAPDLLMQGVALAVAAALLAGLYPARRMARASPAEALRDE